MTDDTHGGGDARLRWTRAWLRYSANDLATARDALRPESPSLPYNAAFWAQQAAEKALKGALTYARVSFDRTHQLDALAAALPEGWETRKLRGTLPELTRFAVETRYPDLGTLETTVDDADLAIRQAYGVQLSVRRDLEARGVVFKVRSQDPAERRATSPLAPPSDHHGHGHG